MLTPLPSRRFDPPYRVPWRVDRADPAHPRVLNASREPADFVRAFVHDDVAPPSSEHWGLVLPEEICELCLCERALASTLVTLAWFRPGEDDEYLWRFCL